MVHTYSSHIYAYFYLLQLMLIYGYGYIYIYIYEALVEPLLSSDDTLSLPNSDQVLI